MNNNKKKLKTKIQKFQRVTESNGERMNEKNYKQMLFCHQIDE